MNRPHEYVGVNNDINGAMTTIGKTIRDAQVFALIPETETGENWNLSRVNALLQEVNNEWDKYGCLYSLLPDELQQRHRRIHGKAMEKAKQAGWSGELETCDEE